MSDLAQDRPIERARDDRLDRTPFVENLARALVYDEKDDDGRFVARRATGIVVGLTGKWGSGKSSIVNLLADHLGGVEHVAVATFNPWLFQGRDELFAAFFDELRDALGRSSSEKVREARTALDKYRADISAGGQVVAFAADTVAPAWVGKAILKGLAGLKLITRPKDLLPQEERRALEEKLEKAEVAVVVLIDELDRIEDDDVRAVAQLVKAVGDIKGISYLVAYDPERVADALGRGEGESRRRSGEAYLEKIVQHPIPLRPLFTHDVERLLDRLLEHHGVQLPPDLTDSEIEVVACIRNAVSTPREIKRLAGAYAVLDRMLRLEVSAADLLGYCWLLTKAPALRDAIARNLEAFVDDPNAPEMTRRVVERIEKMEPSLDEALGVTAKPHEELLQLLFPRFGEGGRENSGERLSRRRNLVRTLYLGDAPGITSRVAVERLWHEPDEAELALALRRLLAEGELRPILDRLDDLLLKLPERGDVPFFRTLSRALVRDHDWYLEPEPHFAVADDAIAQLFRLGLRERSEAGRVQKIVAALVDDGDLILSPGILRKHLFRWGLTHHSQGERRGEFIFDRRETEDLRDSTDKLYRSALTEGRLLRRIPNCEALFALSNTGNWDNSLRESLTGQLSTYEGRASFAALVVPPGHGIDQLTLDRLMDASLVQSRMEAAGEGKEVKSWIDACLRRLRRSLEGRDTVFDHGDEDEED
ncbi:KAP family NTPase [Phenylobacterium sp. LjRoot219]|uniref:KAP family NTPase n=1 Tax=Phenylobacterium sp. LjRoot219 TaxID=3342283 RepID=UPI003ECD1DBE